MKNSNLLLAFMLLMLVANPLTAQEKAKAKAEGEIGNKVKAKQEDILHSFQRLIRNLEKNAKASEKTNPEISKRLQAALSELKKLKIVSQMEDVLKFLSSGGKYNANDVSKKLLVELRQLLDILTLDQLSLDVRLVKELVGDLEKLTGKQGDINKDKADGKDVKTAQKAVESDLEKIKAKLKGIDKESPMAKDIAEAIKDLEDAIKASKKNRDAKDDPKDPKDPKAGDPKDGDPKAGDPKDGDPKDGDPKDGDPKDGDPKAGGPKPPSSKEDGEKVLKEILESIEKLKKTAKENSDQEDSESAESLAEAIRMELEKLIATQKKLQESIVKANTAIAKILKENPTKKASLGRNDRKRFKKNVVFFEAQLVSMRRLKQIFKDEESMVFETAMEMIIEDETMVFADVKKLISSEITVFKGQDVVDALQDILKALEPLEPGDEEAGGGGGGPPPEGQEAPAIKDIAKIVLAHQMQLRNLKNTKNINRMKKPSKEIVESLTGRQKKIDKIINGVIETIKSSK